MKLDLSTWLTSAEASKRLGVKYRTVLDMVRKGQLHPKKYVRPGVAGGAVSMFDPGEVDSLIEKRIAAKTEIASGNDLGPLMHAFVQPPSYQPKLVPAPVLTRPPLPINQKLYLTIDEASEYTGLSKSYIRQNVPGRKIGVNGATVWRRQHLEEMW